MRHTPVNTTLQIVDVIGILAHSLALHIGEFGNIHAVAGGGLHDNVQSRCVGVVCDKGSDTECNLCKAVKILLDCGSALEIQTVGEKYRLRLRIDAERLVMCNHFIAPVERRPGIMTHTGEERRIS